MAASANEYYGEGNDKAEGNQGDSQHSNDDSGHSEDESSVEKPALFNCIQKFLGLRDDLKRRREALMQTKLNVKLPKNFGEFFMYKKSYLIKNNKDAQKSIPFVSYHLKMKTYMACFWNYWTSFFLFESKSLYIYIEYDKMI